jgi:excinuclease ABC subunit B
LVHIQYVRNSSAFYPGTFRVQGDTIDVYPLYDDHPIRIEWFDDEVERIARFDGLTGKTLETLETLSIFPSTHFVTPQDQLKRAAQTISEELDARVRQLHEENRLVEAQRLSQRTQFDLEMMMETGYCSGIENYSRHLDGRPEGTPPSTLLDYFPDDFLLFIDESHVGVSQVGGMYHGDRNRKTTLVEYGFRLPSARDNRPLTLEEFWQRTNQVVFVSATPGDFEVSLVDGEVVEQIIRPTGLMDPLVDVRPPRGQIEDLLTEISLRAAVEERALVTTLTKKMAEDLAGFFEEHGVKVAYLHSDIDAIERIEILQALRKGVYDVVVGVNLLREGLDLPEVSLVAILDADKEGFLRSRRSLIQTIGRAARNTNGMVIMYADKITDAMRFAIEETARRRNLQHEYNQRHGITPQTVKKDLRTAFEEGHGVEWIAEVAESDYFLPEEAERTWSPKELKEKMAQLEQEMRQHAAQLAFEEAARCRDELSTLKLEWMKLQ